jgi:hypothetical protein
MNIYLKILPIVMLISIWGCSSDAKADKSVEQLVIKKVHHYKDDFGAKNATWKQYEGEWVFANGALTQTARDKYFPLILLENEKYGNVDISVKFESMSGRIDASGGLVFRAQDSKNYYIVRANALEDNFRLYYFKDGGRYEIASANVTPPTMKHYSTIRVVAKGDHIQAYLNGKLEIDHHDKRYSRGYVGLWTKADSVTAFDDFEVGGE